MALRQTEKLLAEYENELKDGNISDKRLDALLASNNFIPFLPPFRLNKLYLNILDQPTRQWSHQKYTESDGMIDFVQTAALLLSSEILDELVGRIIPKISTDEKNETLALVLLAYQKHTYPEDAKKYQLAQKPFLEQLESLVNYFAGPCCKLSPSPFSTSLQKLDQFINVLKSENQLGKEQKVYLAKIRQVRTTVFLLERNNKAPLEDLTTALEATYKLVTNKMSLENYNTVANKIQGNASSDLQILGIAMLALGAVYMVLGATLVTIPLLGLGGAFVAVGLFSYNYGRQTGLSKDMSLVADTKERLSAIK